ncbi:DUF6510 family protein [Streptomyces sp. NBC_01643]|nr:DUF6510 family protein [Streptomyces sp. NBC_01643]
MASVEAGGPHVDDTHAGYIDGNALAGPPSEVFAVVVTAATSPCANCGCTGPLARLNVYRHAHRSPGPPQPLSHNASSSRPGPDGRAPPPSFPVRVPLL